MPSPPSVCTQHSIPLTVAVCTLRVCDRQVLNASGIEIPTSPPTGQASMKRQHTLKSKIKDVEQKTSVGSVWTSGPAKKEVSSINTTNTTFAALLPTALSSCLHPFLLTGRAKDEGGGGGGEESAARS